MASDSEYHPDPLRRCGRKVPGGYYLESEVQDGGDLRLWTWILGSGTEDGENCYMEIPPRKVLTGNPAASLASGEFVGNEVPFAAKLDADESTAMMRYYMKLSSQVGRLALFDHVGSSYYTPYNFALEVAKYGPSRRIPSSIAAAVAKYLPVLIVFTHGDMPVFKNIEQRDGVLYHAREAESSFEWSKVQYSPTWMTDKWGVQERNSYNGGNHYMSLLLEAMSLEQIALPAGALEALANLKAEMSLVPKMEQPFGASWITRATYVKKEDDTEEEIGEIVRKGIGVLELEVD